MWGEEEAANGVVNSFVGRMRVRNKSVRELSRAEGGPVKKGPDIDRCRCRTAVDRIFCISKHDGRNHCDLQIHGPSSLLGFK